MRALAITGSGKIACQSVMARLLVKMVDFDGCLASTIAYRYSADC